MKEHLYPVSLKTVFSFILFLCVLVCVAVWTNRTLTQLYTALTVQDLFAPRVYIDLYCVPVVPLCRSANTAKPKDIKLWGCSNSLAFFPPLHLRKFEENHVESDFAQVMF